MGPRERVLEECVTTLDVSTASADQPTASTSTKTLLAARALGNWIRRKERFTTKQGEQCSRRTDQTVLPQGTDLLGATALDFGDGPQETQNKMKKERWKGRTVPGNSGCT